MNVVTSLTCNIHSRLDHLGHYYTLLVLRILMAYEIFESGLAKYTGTNWFNEPGYAPAFPFPFNLLSTDTNWFLATWSELIGAIALLIGFATRFFAASLIVVITIAWLSKHAGLGYNVGDGGYKFSLIYIVLLIPFVLNGPGRASIDHFIKHWFFRNCDTPGYSSNSPGIFKLSMYGIMLSYSLVWIWLQASLVLATMGLEKGTKLKETTALYKEAWSSGAIPSVIAVVCIIVILAVIPGMLSRFADKKQAS